MATNEQMPEPANDSAEEIDAEAENIVTELLCSRQDHEEPMQLLVELMRGDDERRTRFWASAIYILARKTRYI